MFDQQFSGPIRNKLGQKEVDGGQVAAVEGAVVGQLEDQLHHVLADDEPASPRVVKAAVGPAQGVAYEERVHLGFQPASDEGVLCGQRGDVEQQHIVLEHEEILPLRMQLQQLAEQIEVLPEQPVLKHRLQPHLRADPVEAPVGRPQDRYLPQQDVGPVVGIVGSRHDA